MITRDDIVTEARDWLEVKWVHQGRSRLGVDCAGLVIVVGNDLKLLDGFDTTGYQRRTHGTDFLKHFKTNMCQKPVVDAKPGDVILFRDGYFPCHATIVGERRGKLTIIHAHALHRRVIEEMLDQGDWLERRVACFAFKGLEN